MEENKDAVQKTPEGREAKVSVIKPTLEFLDPKMPNQQKIATMARLCYKSESTGPESDARIVGTCIERGHGSVCEHAMISVVFSKVQIKPETLKTTYGEKHPALADDPKISPLSMFGAIDLLPLKFIFNGSDSEIINKLDPKWVEDHKGHVCNVDVKLGNARAWYDITDALCSVGLANIMAYPMIGGLAFKLLDQLNDIIPAMFCKLYEKYEKALAEARKMNQNIPGGIEDAMKLLHPEIFDVWANQSASNASMSVILRTSRSVTHEIVRHNHSFIAVSQESQRYVNYQNKGFEFIHPMLDVVRFADFKLTCSDGVERTIDADGYLPEESHAFEYWIDGRRRDVNEYLDYKEMGLPPEFDRGCFPNDAATSIGLTFTYPSFLNFVRLRLDNTAFFPFRKFVAKMLVEGYSMQHPFLMSLAYDKDGAEMVKDWMLRIKGNHLYTNVEMIDDIINKLDGHIGRIVESAKAAQEQLKKIQEHNEKMTKEHAEPVPAHDAPASPSAE